MDWKRYERHATSKWTALAVIIWLVATLSWLGAGPPARLEDATLLGAFSHETLQAQVSNMTLDNQTVLESALLGDVGLLVLGSIMSVMVIAFCVRTWPRRKQLRWLYSLPLVALITSVAGHLMLLRYLETQNVPGVAIIATAGAYLWGATLIAIGLLLIAQFVRSVWNPMGRRR